MPFDPDKPAFGSPDSSAELRAQFNALNDKIDATPAGPAGPPGQGLVFREAWDGTASYAPYDLATHLGACYLCTASVSPTPTVPPDDAAHWALFAQRGGDGTNGTNGNDGAPGEVTTVAMQAAIDAAVQAALINMLASSSANTNAVPTLDTPFTNDPPTLADLELMRTAYNTLVLTQRR